MLKNKLGWLVLSALLFSFSTMQVLAASVGHFNDPGFASTWQRIDKPVTDLGTGAGRGYTWGPAFPLIGYRAEESYNGITRTVQYFDKARMEVNNPAADPKSPYYVTTGLLVKEMVSGLQQDGDNTFTQFYPNNTQIAGDPNFSFGNVIAPTYASFKEVATIDPSQNRAVAASAKLINQRIAKNGQVQTVVPPEQRFFATYDSVTGHNIADVFDQFANQSGPIWNGSSYVSAKIFSDNPTYVLGRPITEPYWVRAIVGGFEQDVLVQLFERRVLTYTPSNPASYRVEMGNIGQAYYNWRYVDNAPPVKIASNIHGKVAVVGSYVFWTEGDDQHTTIHGYNTMTQTSFTVPDTAGQQLSLASNGYKLIWLQTTDPHSSLGGTIQMYDLTTGERTTLLDRGATANFVSLAIDLNSREFYYQDATQGHQGLFIRDVYSGQERLIAAKGTNPVASYDGVVWREVSSTESGTSPTYTLHLLNLGATQDIVLSTDQGDFTGYDFTDGFVIWSRFPPAINQGVYRYGINTGTTFVAAGPVQTPLTDSRQAMWVDPYVPGTPVIDSNFGNQMTRPVLQGVTDIKLWAIIPNNGFFYSGSDGLYYKIIS